MGTTAEKLTYLNGTKRLLRRRINSLGGSITLETKFRDYLLWLDRFYNAASSGVDFELLGDTKQYAVNSSANALPLYDDEIVTDGITVTVSDGGKITINGTATRDVWIKITNGMEAVYTEPVLYENNEWVDVYGWLNETVLDFGEGTNIITSNYHGGGDTPINANSDARIYQYITKEDGTIREASTGYNDFVNRENYFSDKDRISSGDIDNARRINCLYLFFNQGITVNQYFYKAISYESLNPWVANNDALPASPDNPKYFWSPDDITYTASDGTEFPISLGTGNMLKLKDGTYTDNGITAVVSNNEITLNGTVSNKTSSIEIPSNLETLSGDYTLSLHDISGTYTGYDSRASNFSYFRVQSKSNNSKYMSVEVSLNNGSYRHDDFSNEEVKVVMRTSPSYGTITFTDYKFKPQVLKGWYKTEPPYIPYSSIELCKIGDYEDRIYYKNGKFYCERKTGVISPYNGETITTDYLSSTGGLNTGSTIYYVLDSPVTTEITEENGEVLYTQLKAIIDHETKLEIEKKIF